MPGSGSRCTRHASGSTSCSTAGDELQLSELHLLADDPDAKAAVLAELLEAERDGTSVRVGDSVVSFIPGGPQGRPQLHGELLT